MEDIRFEQRLRVPFFDVDPMQVVWHGHYLKYFDITRQNYALQCGLDFYAYSLSHGFVFPVIKQQVKYVYPLRYHDDFICAMTLRDVSVKVVMDFEIRLVRDNRRCASGRTEQVALRLPDFEMELAIPEDVQAALLSGGRESS
jgi:acyl-CoA thioester hydrolase